MSSVNSKRNSLGRPTGSDNDKVRADLLEAARRLFLGSEFKAVSIRQIAESAGVNGAMVSYYFGGKQGLYLAMVEELLQTLEQSLKKLTDDPSHDSHVSIAEFSSSYCQLLAENPWWPNFMVREVLFSDGEIRQAIIKKFGVAMAPRLLQSIQSEISSGHFRSDLNPGLTLMSIMGMTIFPFLAKPIVEKLLDLRIDDSIVPQLAAHNTQLFLHGVKAPVTRSKSESEGRRS